MVELYVLNVIGKLTHGETTLDPKYCDVIIKRWETLTGMKAELKQA